MQNKKLAIQISNKYEPSRLTEIHLADAYKRLTLILEQLINQKAVIKSNGKRGNKW